MTVGRTNLIEYGEPYRGKVRDVYDLGDRLLSVATDGVSVFDVVLPDLIPGKGAILTLQTESFFEALEDFGVAHHLLRDVAAQKLLADVEAAHPELRNHTLVWRKTEPIEIEFIVRRHIFGTLYGAYKKSADGKVWGIQFPANLAEGADICGEMVFTPTTKAHDGHDQPLTYEEYEAILVARFGEQVGKRLTHDLMVHSLNLGEWGYDRCQQAGIILADTKFEMGVVPGEETANGLPKVIVIDEIFTPDSSRFWPEDKWKKGQIVSLDKQFVRDHVLAEAKKLGLKSGTPEFDVFVRALRLPAEVIKQTTERYQEIAKLLP